MDGKQWLQEPDSYVRAACIRRQRSAAREGWRRQMDDLSHSGDAAGYAVYRLAAIRQWKTGSSKSELHPCARVW